MHSDHYFDSPKKRYVNLTTYRHDGSEVSNPVWIVGKDDRLFFGTDRDKGKYKRLRNGGRVLFAPCDFRGKKILGEWHEAKARRLNEDEIPLREEVEEAFLNKYGWRYRLMMFIYRWTGLHAKRELYELKELTD